jgi:DNA repair exonuclease SbcCD ATPase subunit
MPRAKYRIAEVAIEGFRGFTERQSLVVDEKNLFIFGKNGHGKSSIVEAIRWCLFGSASGADIEVRNTFYDKGCRVSLLLKGEVGILRVDRELRPGADRSRQLIYDSAGKEVPARQALPGLNRLGVHDSAQVIFAAQHAGGRQLTADISDFGRVLCFYIHLEDVPDLLKKLSDLHKTKTVETEALSRDIESVAASIRDKRKVTQLRLEQIVANAPWGKGASPNLSQTTDRISEFAAELANFVDDTLPDNLKPQQALQKATAWIDAISIQQTATTESKCTQLSERINRLSNLFSELKAVRDVIAINTKSFEQHQRDIQQVLGKQTPDRLRAHVRQLEHNQTERSSCASIATRVREMSDEFDLTKCPACGTEFGDGELFARANDLADVDLDSVRENTTLEQEKRRLQRFEVSNAAKVAVDAALKEYKRTELSKIQNIATMLKISPADGLVDATVNGHLAKMRSELDTLQRRRNNRIEEQDKWLAQMRALQQELNFHSHVDELTKLDEKLSAGMLDALDLLADYHNLLEQMQRLRVVIEQGFRLALDRAIPKLNDMFTGVYQRLTQQLSYERVSVYHDPENTGKLELRVTSDQLPGQDFAINVLNGQARRAIDLVPYLVFSKFQSDILDLDLLVIDDPSESFDTSHVAMLVEELLSATEHAQIVVASHEEEKFNSELCRLFSAESYTNIYVRNFSPLKGPTIEQSQ